MEQCQLLSPKDFSLNLNNLDPFLKVHQLLFDFLKKYPVFFKISTNLRLVLIALNDKK
jgi:hypothetical protein